MWFVCVGGLSSFSFGVFVVVGGGEGGLSFLFFYTFKGEMASLCLDMAPLVAETELLSQASVTGACGQAEN